MLHEVSFQSFNDRDEVQGWIYVPAAKPRELSRSSTDLENIPGDICI